MNYKQYINHWKINKSMLAEKIGMPIGTFSCRFNNSGGAKFTEEDILRIKSVLQTMAVNFKCANIKVKK